MSDESGDLLNVSPTSSSADTTVLHEDGDVQLFGGSRTKEELKSLALAKLAELRADKASLQRDKDNALLQVAELRRLIHDVQHPTTSSVSSSQSALPVHPPSVHNQLSTNRQSTKPALPDKFNGVDKAQVITNWLFSIRLYLRVTRTDIEDYVMMATTFFAGTALDWWQGIERVEGESIYNWSWAMFEERCIRRFQATNDAQLAFQKLLRWKQTGHIATYLSVFQSLIQQIPLTLLTEQGRVFVLIEGLNTELQKSVRLMQPATVDEAINVAQRASATYHTPSLFHQTSTRSNYRHTSPITKSSNQFNRTATGSRFAPLVVENVEEVNETQPNSPSGHSEGRTYLTELEFSYLNAEQKKLYREKRCFNCKKIGHFSSECRSIKE